MNAEAQGRALKEAMDAFHNYLREAQQLIDAADGLSSQERADGYAYLMGLMVKITQMAMANVDTTHPYFRRSQDTFSKYGLDNPDNLYAYACVDDASEYRIKGTRGTGSDFLFQIFAGNPGDGSLAQIIDQLDLSRLQFNPDGTYEVIISRNPQPRNWLKSGPGASVVLLRECFGDDWPHQRKGAVFIERIGGEGTPAPTPTPAQIAARIGESGRLLAAHIRYWIEFNDNMVGPTPVNAIAKPWATVGGIAGQFISAGKYNLADDEALVLTFEPVSVRYANILMADLFWFITYRLSRSADQLRPTRTGLPKPRRQVPLRGQQARTPERRTGWTPATVRAGPSSCAGRASPAPHRSNRRPRSSRLPTCGRSCPRRAGGHASRSAAASSRRDRRQSTGATGI